MSRYSALKGDQLKVGRSRAAVNPPAVSWINQGKQRRKENRALCLKGGFTVRRMFFFLSSRGTFPYYYCKANTLLRIPKHLTLLPSLAQASGRAPSPTPSRRPAWCTLWPTPAPWASWRRAAATRSGAATKRPSASSCTACSWRPSTEAKAWCTAWWSTSPRSHWGPRTPGSGGAAAPMWSLARSSPGTSWTPARPTGTSTPGWGSTTTEWEDRWGNWTVGGAKVHVPTHSQWLNRRHWFVLRRFEVVTHVPSD